MSYYSVGESSRLKAEKEFRRRANELIFHIGMKVGSFTKKGIFSQEISNVAIRVNAEEVYHYDVNKGVKQNLSPESVYKINTAFDEPKDLKGSVIVEVNSKAVFYAQDGELFMNSNDLIYPHSHPNKLSLEDKSLIRDIESITALWEPTMYTGMGHGSKNKFCHGIPIDKNLGLVCSGPGEETKKFLSVNSKKGKKIFDRNGFTEDATQDEIRNLKKRVCEIKDITLIEPELENLLSPLYGIMIQGLESYDLNLDYCVYENEKYYFSNDDAWGDWLTVTSKESDKEIFNNFGFTNDASEEDKNELRYFVNHTAKKFVAEQEAFWNEEEKEQAKQKQEAEEKEAEAWYSDYDESDAYEAYQQSLYEKLEESFLDTQPEDDADKYIEHEGVKMNTTMPFGKDIDIDFDL